MSADDKWMTILTLAAVGQPSIWCLSAMCLQIGKREMSTITFSTSVRQKGTNRMGEIVNNSFSEKVATVPQPESSWDTFGVLSGCQLTH